MDKKTFDKRYKLRRWRDLRLYVLTRDKFICQYFKRFGVHKIANTVHHINPAKEYPSLFWQSKNLIAVSEEAHNILEDRSNGRLTAEGIKIQRLYNKKNKILI